MKLGKISGTFDMSFFPGGGQVDDLGVVFNPLLSKLGGEDVMFVAFPGLIGPDYCLREAGARGSNFLTPTI
jgi:hypothetical protein